MKKDNAESITIPYFSVTLHNDGNESISLPLQGECLLWPPEHSWDYECGYEFKQADGSDIDYQAITVPAKGEKEYLIHVTKLINRHKTESIKKPAKIWPYTAVFDAEKECRGSEPVRIDTTWKVVFNLLFKKSGVHMGNDIKA